MLSPFLKKTLKKAADIHNPVFGASMSAIHS